MTLYFIFALEAFAKDVYERSCMVCHQELTPSLEKIFMNYLLIYGGEKNMKAGLKHYLKYPIKEISVMDDESIKKHGIKQSSTLRDEVLEEAIEIYWDKFKIFGKLK